MKQFRQFKPKQFQFKPFVQPFMQQQNFAQQIHTHVFSLSKRWMLTILSVLQEKFGLSLTPQHRLRKTTYVDQNGNFTFTVKGYLAKQNELYYTVLHHWQIDQKTLITYAWLIRNNKPSEVVIYWELDQNKIPQLREIKELS